MTSKLGNHVRPPVPPEPSGCGSWSRCATSSSRCPADNDGLRRWPIDTTGAPHFSDVPANNTFYTFIETAYNRQIISGYADGTFRWGSNATRGQIAKIVYNAVTQP